MTQRYQTTSLIRAIALGPIAFFSILLAISAIVALLSASRANQAGRIPQSLQALLATVKDAEMGQRGYLLTRKDEYLEPYQAALQRLPTLLANAAEASENTPGTANLGRLVAAKRAEMADTIARARAGHADAAPAEVDGDASQHLTDQIHAIILAQSNAARATIARSDMLVQAFVLLAIASGSGLGIASVLNILALLRSRRELAASERRLQLLIAGVHDHAIYMLDEHGLIMTWNTGAELLKGFTAAEAIGRPYEMLFSPEARRAGVPAALLHTARTRGYVKTENQVFRRDGSMFTAHITLTALFDEANILQGYCKVARNITEQREAERVLSTDRDKLAALVEERSRSLRETQASLAHVQRIGALGQLAGGIAHDFNNVMQAVQGCAGLIELYSSDQKIQGLARSTAEVVERGSAITRRLLAFSRHGTLHAEPVSADALLANLSELLIHTLGTGINIVVDAPATLPEMAVDKWQLETVLVNLAANARDAMGITGNLTFAATLDDVPREAAPNRPAALKPGRYLRLTVADTGTGMAPNVRAHATEPFFTTKAAGHGTGLGLTMARGFAEQSGGGLYIESTLGRGTTIMLWFPLADTIHPQKPTPSAPTPAPTKGACILLVDDNEIVRDVTAEQLETVGYTVITAKSAFDALLVLSSTQRIDLLATDLSMPGMDGIACIREAHKRRPALPAILITGFASNTTELAVQGALTTDFSLLYKPVVLKQLVSRIEELLTPNLAPGAHPDAASLRPA